MNLMPEHVKIVDDVLRIDVVKPSKKQAHKFKTATELISDQRVVRLSRRYQALLVENKKLKVAVEVCATVLLPPLAVIVAEFISKEGAKPARFLRNYNEKGKCYVQSKGVCFAVGCLSVFVQFLMFFLLGEGKVGKAIQEASDLVGNAARPDGAKFTSHSGKRSLATAMDRSNISTMARLLCLHIY